MAIAEQEPPLRKARVFESFRDVLTSAASPRPVVLVIEDTHSIEPLSTELLSFIVGLAPRSRRPVAAHAPPRVGAALGERPYYASVRLPSLSESDAISLAQAADGGAALPSRSAPRYP